MSPQILITGATGFIGRGLTRDLVEQGHALRILARDQAMAQELFGDEVEIVRGDVRDAESLTPACAGIETVYHIAGTYRFGLRHRRELRETNVEGAENLFRAAEKAGVERVVHLSSAGVLEAGKGEEPGALLSEADFPAQPPRFCVYKASKWEAEQRALAAVRRGLPVVIANTTCPIGRGDEAPTPTGQMIRDFLRRRFPFYCHTGLNFIGLEDLSLGLQAAAAHGQPGERYLLSDENLWLKDFLDLLARESRVAAPSIALPHAIIRLAGVGGELLDLLRTGDATARLCLETAAQAARTQFFSNARAKDELHWSPSVPLVKSVREAIAWFRRETMLDMPAASRSSSVESHVR